MAKKTLFSSLHIQQYELTVFLGWPKEERRRKQSVWMDMDIVYPTPPKACRTDELDDTTCYHQLTDLIQKQLANQKTHLIEQLSYEIYLIAKSQLPKKVKVAVRITKYPAMKALKGGVCFRYGDIA
jgi:dihydroneopterin aldolase